MCLSIILSDSAKLCFCSTNCLLSVQQRAAERTRCTAVAIIAHLSVLWFEFRYISVSCGGYTCFLHAHFCDSVCSEDLGRNSEFHAWFDVFAVSASSLWWTDNAVNKSSTQKASPLLHPLPSAFQYADGCLASCLGEGSPLVTCGIQGLYQIKKVQL